MFKPLVRTTCYFQGVFTTMAPICVVVVCIYVCVQITLPYYSVTAQLKLTLFSPLFLLLLLLCLYRARSLKGFCVWVCGCVQFGYSKTLISANTTTRSSHRAARALTRAHTRARTRACTHTSIPLLRLVCRLSPQHYENEHVD